MREWLGSGDKETTDYDVQGRVTSSRAFGGDALLDLGGHGMIGPIEFIEARLQIACALLQLRAERAALAETLGSVAGNLCVDITKEMVVGLEINANHVRAMRNGVVTGTARALHVGRSTQLWEIRIENDDGKLVCVSRLTLAVVPRS